MRKLKAPLPDWPRLMSEDLAAAYLSISATMLRVHGPPPLRLGRRILFDRHHLDRWVDHLSGQPLGETEEQDEAAEVERKFLERRSGKRPFNEWDEVLKPDWRDTSPLYHPELAKPKRKRGRYGG